MFFTKLIPSQKMFGIVALTLMAAFFTGCDSEVEDPNATITVPEDVAPVEDPVVQTEEVPETTPQTEGTPILADADSAIEDLIGETVTVSTKVQEDMGDGVFSAYDVESMRGETILVISEVATPAVGTNIEVTGEVRPFDVATIEGDYGIDLSPDVETEYEGKPYLDATAIEPVD